MQLHMRCGDNEVVLTPSNTGLRMFDQGHGLFDHCVYVDTEGRSIAFKPDDRLKKELINSEFPLVKLPVIDEAAWNFHQEWTRARTDNNL